MPITSSHQTLFKHTSQYACSAAELYSWHSRKGALERLMPPWEKSTVLMQKGGIEPGGQVEIKMHAGPFPFKFRARHTDNIPGEMFRDIQEQGPFANWSHSHYFEDTDKGSILKDVVEYSLPGHRFLPRFIKNYVTRNLHQLFHHRETLLSEDINLHQRCSTNPLRILITGASGVLGRELMPLLTTGGHQIWRLVRKTPDRAKGEIYWDPANNILNGSDLPELDGVIHLAGEYIGLSRWSEDKKRRVIDSRIKGTELLTKVLAAQDRPPKAFLCASAVGYYGDCLDRLVDESHPSGTDYISEVCRLWEQGTRPASEAGIRTIFMRLGVGFTPRGGGLQRILTTSPLGFIRRFGSGKQYISWISTDDMVSAMLHSLTCQSLEGPVNIAAPLPVSNIELMKTLAQVTGRPLLFPLSAKVLQIVYGQMASEILLSGCRVSVRKLQDSGFKFRHPDLETALRSMLGKTKIEKKEKTTV